MVGIEISRSRFNPFALGSVLKIEIPVTPVEGFFLSLSSLEELPNATDPNWA